MPTVSTLHGSHEVPDGKLTALGLYVTAAEAYEMWKADPERVKVLDVRMVEEYVFLGHAEGAVNIPVAVHSGSSRNAVPDCRRPPQVVVLDATRFRQKRFAMPRIPLRFVSTISRSNQ